MCEEFQLDIDKELLHRISFGFAGGLGNSGAVCGAVVGAVMAIGLKRNRVAKMDEVLQELAVSREFRNRFEAEMGTINCREMTGMDLTTEAGVTQFMGSDIPQKVCFPAVALAYRLVVDMLKETS